MELKAYAKINLSLDVLHKRPDGYHDVRMIMQTVGLYDRVFIDVIKKDIEVSCNLPWVPTGSGNIAYKAAKLIIDKYRIDRGVRIKLEKRIPVAAGLAGGSTDAAAALKGINQLFSLGLDEQELMKLGKEVGADVPFCIKGGTMLSEGIGEVLTALNPFDGVSILLVKPKISVSTAWVYQNLVLDRIEDRPDTELIISAVGKKDMRMVARNMRNVLESVTQQKYEVIPEIKHRLLEIGALGSMMSGSGPTVFGIFENSSSAKNALDRLKGERWECYLTETIG